MLSKPCMIGIEESKTVWFITILTFGRKDKTVINFDRSYKSDIYKWREGFSNSFRTVFNFGEFRSTFEKSFRPLFSSTLKNSQVSKIWQEEHRLGRAREAIPAGKETVSPSLRLSAGDWGKLRTERNSMNRSPLDQTYLGMLAVRIGADGRWGAKRLRKWSNQSWRLFSSKIERRVIVYFAFGIVFRPEHFALLAVLVQMDFEEKTLRIGFNLPKTSIDESRRRPSTQLTLSSAWEFTSSGCWIANSSKVLLSPRDRDTRQRDLPNSSWKFVSEQRSNS